MLLMMPPRRGVIVWWGMLIMTGLWRQVRDIF